MALLLLAVAVHLGILQAGCAGEHCSDTSAVQPEKLQGRLSTALLMYRQNKHGDQQDYCAF
jgi:hypothetical protein